MTAQLDVIVTGYEHERCAGTVSLIRDDEAVIVVDPGMVSHRDVILNPLGELGITPDAVTEVHFTKHQHDHTWHT